MSHWYAIGNEAWQPLHAPEGQELVVLRAVAQALPDQRVKLASGADKRPAATYVVRAASREHVVMVYPARPPQ